MQILISYIDINFSYDRGIRVVRVVKVVRDVCDFRIKCSIRAKGYNIWAYRTISTLPPSFLVQRLHNNLTAAVITAHRSEVSSFI